MNFEPIGKIRSPFKEKFGIPRQAEQVKDIECTIELNSGNEFLDAVRELGTFSHIWIIFIFHHLAEDSRWTGLVRPPRLGGVKKVGTFASRSPHRPNPIGISAVELVRVEKNQITVRGGDFLDGTPVLDIKPYLAFSDSIPEANTGWVGEPPSPSLCVEFSEEASRVLGELQTAVEKILALDPRPAFQSEGSAEYSMLFDGFDIHFEISGELCRVIRVENRSKV